MTDLLDAVNIDEPHTLLTLIEVETKLLTELAKEAPRHKMTLDEYINECLHTGLINS
jgi:hypothetical protein